MGYIAFTGKVTPAKVAPNEPNMEMKLMIIGRLGYKEKINNDIEHVAVTKRIHVDIIENILELRLKFNRLNINTFANIAMDANIAM